MISILLLCALLAQPTPELNVFIQSTPTTIAQVGEQITFQANIFSTHPDVEMLHIEAHIEPYMPFVGAGVIQDSALGPVSCLPTLTRLSCDVPIKQFKHVIVIGLIDAPFANGCKPTITYHIVAILPNRQTIADRSIVIDTHTLCTYIPMIYGT